VSEGVSAFTQGYNVSVLAYGQSGAGKSYTMGTTNPGEQSSIADMGIIPRAAAALFEELSGSNIPRHSSRSSSQLQTKSSGSSVGNEANWQLKATYVEIYNEELRDLLVSANVPANEQVQVQIREDKGRIMLVNAKQVEITSVNDLMNALHFGSAIRQTDSTAINSKSSRSHAVFSLNLVQKKRKASVSTISSLDSPEGADGMITLDSKLHFVDLAGSERLKNSGLTGERVKEGISINAGLAALGKVISQLSSRAAGSHVSYRDSRLTRLLQDSMGGNAFTYMVACINPVEFHLSETLNTVQYAQRARSIQSRPQLQQRSDENDKQHVIDRLRSEVALLRDQQRMLEHSERRNASQTDLNGRKQARELELQNQLLDIQENYSTLSQRHAKLLADLAKQSENDPAVSSALRNTSLERLNRSSTFAEAVEQVVIEYEKTIQSLESSLSKTRSALSTSESEVLERDAKIVYLEAVQQQLQARVQKVSDREQSSESYLRELEAKIDGMASGEDKNSVLVQELRDELARVRESESSAEEYISTLEERLAEAEQDTEVMQREINRLEHTVQRQRSIGKLDNMLTELDHLQSDEIYAVHGAPIRARGSVAHDAFHDLLVATTTATNPHEEMLPSTAEEEWKDFGPMEGADDSESETTTDYDSGRSDQKPSPKVNGHHQSNNPAQAKAIADKMEIMTIELFDLRLDHESTVSDLTDVTRKYQSALRTLAELQEAFDGANKSRPGSSFLDRAGMCEPSQGGQHSSSRMLSSELSSRGESPTLVEVSEAGTSYNSEMDVNSRHVSRIMQKEETLAEAIRSLKRAQAEKDITINELAENYTQLQDQHMSTLNYIEELKEEMQKARTVAPSLVRRRSAPLLSTGRESKVFSALQNLAVEHMSNQPDALKTFQSNIEYAVTELNLRTERVRSLEAETAATREELEAKNTLISGLNKERSSKRVSMMDFSHLTSTQEQLVESQRQIAAMQEVNVVQEEKLASSIDAFKKHSQYLSSMPVTNGHAEADNDNGKTASAEAFQAIQADLKQCLASFQSMRSTGDMIMQNVAGVETTLRNTQSRQGARSEPIMSSESAISKEVTALQKEVDRYKATADVSASKFMELENSYTQLVREVEADNKSRDAMQKELQAHRELVSNFGSEVDQHKTLATFYQQGMQNTQDSHSRALEDLKKQLDMQVQESDRKLQEQASKHEIMSAALREELANTNAQNAHLTRTVSKVLPEHSPLDNLGLHLQSMVSERQGYADKHAQATKDLAAADRIKDDLEYRVRELTALNEETLKQLEISVMREQKTSRLAKEIQKQRHGGTPSLMVDGVDKDQAELERQLEAHRTRNHVLEAELAATKRLTLNSNGSNLMPSDSYSVRRASDNASDISRHTSPPPSGPLPSLPHFKPALNGSSTNSPVLVSSVHPANRDLNHGHSLSRQPSSNHLQATITDQETRIRTIEKHLYAEKQLTQTLEEALVDLENQANRTKADMEAWKRKCRELEEEASNLRREKGSMRNSLQAVEEERDRRIRAEAARRQLEERMEVLAKGKKNKKNALNCF
jgi:predicted  nucleic acid-binding Zn-ribbon protein